MFNTYKIVVFSRNMSDGESEETTRKGTEKEAIDLFYNKCSSVGTNPQTKCCMVTMFDMDGNIVKLEKIDNSQYIAEDEIAVEE